MALRAAETYSLKKTEFLRHVYVRPHADGISNLSYRNYDDWKVIAWGTCSSLIGVQAPGMQVNCAPKTW